MMMRRSVDTTRSPEYWNHIQGDEINALRQRVRQLENDIRAYDDKLEKRGVPELAWERADLKALLMGKGNPEPESVALVARVKTGVTK